MTVGLGAVSVAAGDAWAGPEVQRCSERYEPVWTMPLQSKDVGQSINNVFERGEFYTVRNVSGQRDRLAIGRAPDGTVALQMNIPKGENAPVSFLNDALGGVESACLSLRIFFENGFEWAKGGGGTKLGFGIWGGQPSKLSGGVPPAHQKGFSVRNVHSKYGFRLYSYNLNRPGNHGEQGGPGLAPWGSRDWGPGQWHTIEMEVVLNTVGKSDGYAQLWLDGGHRQLHDRMRLRDSKNWKIEGLYFSEMWGGSYERPDFFSPKKQKMWYADYQLYTGQKVKHNEDSTSQPSDQSSNNSSNVSTSNNQSSGNQSSGGSFRAIAPSGPIGTGNTVLQWRPDPNANKYYAKVVNTSTRKTVFSGSAFADKHCSSTACNLSIGSLATGKYEWMVRSQRNSTTLKPYSKLAFVVSSSGGQTAASQPTQKVSSNQSSGNGGSFGAIAPSGTIGTGSVTLQWRPDPNANKYYLQIMTRRTHWSDRRTVFSGSVSTSRCNGTACSLSIGSLPRDQYEWRVRSQRNSTILKSYSTLAFDM